MLLGMYEWKLCLHQFLFVYFPFKLRYNLTAVLCWFSTFWKPLDMTTPHIRVQVKKKKKIAQITINYNDSNTVNKIWNLDVKIIM